MLIYESDYSIFKYDEENSIFSHIFKPATEDLDAEKFKEEMLIYLEYFEKHKPKRALIDNQEMKFTIVPELQEWHAQNVFPRCLEAGIEMAAIVESSDLFPKISVEQLMEEEKTGVVPLKYFENVDEAIEWLLS